MTETPSDLLTVQEVAARLRVHKNTVMKALRDGSLPALRVRKGGVWRVDPGDLVEFMRRNAAARK